MHELDKAGAGVVTSENAEIVALHAPVMFCPNGPNGQWGGHSYAFYSNDPTGTQSLQRPGLPSLSYVKQSERGQPLVLITGLSWESSSNK